MKKNIFLYLFVFAALIALYLIVNAGKMEKRNLTQIQKLEKQVQQLKDSVQDSQLQILDIQYFSLENKKGDNPLVPFEGMNSDFKINKIKVLNHKWILADFSDGQFWGDLVIKYELKDDLSVDFTRVEHLLYSRNN